MSNKDKELLYELYLASLETEIDETIEDLEDIEAVFPVDEELSFEDLNPEDTTAAGNIIVFWLNGYEIWCLITGKEENGYFEAYKLSSFTGLGSGSDLILHKGSSRYLLETDNRIYLSEAEVENSLVIASINAQIMQALQESLLSAKKDKTAKRIDLLSPEAKFRIKEHELTLELRSRIHEDKLWIPQLAIQGWESINEAMPLAAADNGMDVAFSVLAKQQDENVYYAREYTLHKNECQDLILIPDDDYINRKAEIRCNELVVFRGVLPEKLVLASFTPVKVQAAQAFLNISLRLLRD